jgi:hypothetical protein
MILVNFDLEHPFPTIVLRGAASCTTPLSATSRRTRSGRPLMRVAVSRGLATV